jgi:hypothetical protein
MRDDLADLRKASPLRRFEGRITDGVERRLHVVGRQYRPIVKSHPCAQVKNVGRRTGGLPGFGQIGEQVGGSILFDQAIEEELEHPSGCGIPGEPGIEGEGAGFQADGHRLSVRCLALGTGNKRQHQ